MNWKRIKAVGKLLLLFGTPFMVVLGLFGSGVYVGNLYRHGVTSFEKEWLGLDVDVAPMYGASEDPDSDKTDSENKDSDKKDSDKTDSEKKDSDKKDSDKKDSDKTDAADPVREVSTPDPKPAPEPAAPTPLPVEPPAPPVAPQVDPLDGPLAGRLGVPVTVEVKVLVDDVLIEQHPDWIDYVQRTISEASSIYGKQFGITLELASVGRWGVPTAGMSSGELLDDVESRPREAAALVVGFTGRPLDDRTSGKAFTPPEDGPYNGSAAVVYSTRQHGNAHVRGLLHELGHLFGALDITDPSAPGYQSGSWMSYAPVAPDHAPWVDPENRARVLARKDKPFAPAGAMTAAPEAPPQPPSQESPQ